MAKTAKTLVRSLQRGLQIINVVAVRGPVHAKPIARAVGLSLPTAYHLLRTLVHDGYLARLDDGTYVLGARLGDGILPRTNDAAQLASAGSGLTSGPVGTDSWHHPSLGRVVMSELSAETSDH